MQQQIRLSSLIFAVLISIGVVAGLIALRPPLTEVYYMQMGALIAGAGLIVTLYNRFLTARAGRRAQTVEMQEAPAAEPEAETPTVDRVPALAPAVYAETQECELPTETLPEPQLTQLPELTAESLDALLDIAYEAAESEPLRAIAAYRRALARYPDDSYMPYLIIELSTLYKRRGDYDAALRLFDEARALPIIAQNAVMAQEFERSRRALTVVSHMLAAQGTPSLPFGDVPKEIIVEADRRADEPNT